MMNTERSIEHSLEKAASGQGAAPKASSATDKTVLERVVAEFPTPQEGHFAECRQEKRKYHYTHDRVKSRYIRELLEALNSKPMLNFSRGNERHRRPYSGSILFRRRAARDALRRLSRSSRRFLSAPQAAAAPAPQPSHLPERGLDCENR